MKLTDPLEKWLGRAGDSGELQEIDARAAG
jgi:hypothetical protein